MAIKGKGRTRQKQVARGPKPVYSPVRPHPFARRWVQVAAAVLVTLFVVWFASWIRAGLRSERADRDQREQQAATRTVVTQFQGQLEPILQQIGQPSQTGGFDAFPRLQGVIAAMEKGDAKPGEIALTARSTRKTAEAQAGALEKLKPADLAADKGLQALVVTEMIDAQQDIHAALGIYAQAATILGEAGGGQGSRSKLLASAKALDDSANQLLTAGYQKYVDAQNAAGVYQPQVPGSTTGIPGGAGLPIGG